MEKDPSVNWYDGELKFFDNYVIPLAKKLDVCGVFGVSSDECLNYALQNRTEWSTKGEKLVKRYLSNIESSSSSSSSYTWPSSPSSSLTDDHGEGGEENESNGDPIPYKESYEDEVIVYDENHVVMTAKSA